jgi:inulin fructotransferase (DFA-I-forming)
VHNHLDDLYGSLRINGSNNSVIANHFSEVVDSRKLRPSGATPVIIRVVAGGGNFISSNHMVAKDATARTGDSAFNAQVDALLTTETAADFSITAVMIDVQSSGNTILDSGSAPQVIADRYANAVRATPVPGS